MGITSFSIDWYNCGLCCGDSIVHEKTTLHHRKREISIKQYNGMNTMLTETRCKVPKEDIEGFFLMLEQMDAENSWQSDYRVMVCDGWSWTVRIRYSNGTVKRVEGTVDLPPNGNKITKKIRNMLGKTFCIVEPQLFGR